MSNYRIQVVAFVLLLNFLLFSYAKAQTMSVKKKYQMLCLGDSYTIGESVLEEERFPNQLVKLLANQHILFDKPILVAKTGWTTDELALAISQERLLQKYDWVTLLIGVNNQYRKRDLENYKTEFKELLETAIRFAGGQNNRVIIVSIPDWGVTPFGANDARGSVQIGVEIDAFNAVNKSESALAKVLYVNITPISKKASKDATYIAHDHLHPSGKMYQEWAELICRQVFLK